MILAKDPTRAGMKNGKVNSNTLQEDNDYTINIIIIRTLQPAIALKFKYFSVNLAPLLNTQEQ